MKLNLGCGWDYKKGYVNCDISSEVKPDKVLNLEKTLPFEENSVEEVIMNHILEHSQKPINIVKELYRVCKNSAIVKIRVPYFSSESAFSMMDHYSFFSWTSFDFLEECHPCHWQGFGNFKILKKKIKWRKQLWFLEKFFGMFPRIYQEFFCWWFPAKELYVELVVVK